MDQLCQIDRLLQQAKLNISIPIQNKLSAKILQKYNENTNISSQQLKNEIFSESGQEAIDLCSKILNQLKNQDLKTVVDRALQRIKNKQQQNSQQQPKQKIKLTLNLQNTPKIQMQLNMSLPISQFEKQLLQSINQNQVTIVTAETGSGKSTQLPQLLLKYKYTEDLKIIITQPRRISCVQLAQRVQYELQQVPLLQSSVGYKVRFESTVTEKTKVHFLTDGMLLQEAQNGFVQFMNTVNYLIIDEAHEHSVNTDLILGLFKENITQIKTKIIITSASIQTNFFTQFFGQGHVISVPGKLYNIETVFSKKTNNFDERIQNGLCIIRDFLLMKAQKASPFNPKYDGNILFFLPGVEEINQCIEEVTLLVEQLNLQIQLLPLHSRISLQQQNMVFGNEQKIVFATNIAETSVTLPNCTCVIDSGLVKLLQYIPLQHCDVLKTQNIDRSSFIQRKGRCGRVRDGIYYFCGSQEDYSEFLDQNLPEIARIQPDNVILQLIKVRGPSTVGDIQNFQLPYRIPPSYINNGLKRLQRLYLIKQETDLLCLTKLGKQTQSFQVDIQMGLCLNRAQKYGQLAQMSKAAALISSGFQLFLREETSDFITAIKTVDDVLDKKSPYNHQQSQYIKLSYEQLSKEHHDSEIDNFIIQKCLAVGFQDNIAEFSDSDRCYYRIDTLKHEQVQIKRKTTQFQFKTQNTDDQLYIHPGSELFKQTPKPRYVLFGSLLETKKKYMMYCAEVQIEVVKQAIREFQVEQKQTFDKR
ncbi:Pre-mRNA-splicing_factor ATP-dependent RNA helicase [Hexamita inflata]|uniref:Pre-mRNA-splicing factor ATP-dependent RNA helicase n=2 Tax=Hexamita inflata TaxID=28002 RepID=A0AA86NKX3_9EUKA|nr:Pre-mRNA-splicing factor ATP-dependent RNA helicase [Hexamita inflata]CAI9921770.1 Pre-mRNA-splicing factor ATP-dependent RNA helicase [Hexamita inflata]